MSKFWMMIIAIIALAWVGGYATDASAKTNAEVRACVDQRFAAAPFTGTLADKELQATRLPAGKPFGTPEITLPEGGTLWGYCKNDAPAMASADAALIEALKAENARLTDLAYTKTSKGPVSWKSVATDRAGQIEDLEGKLGTATAAATSAANWSWLFGILLAAMTIVSLWMYRRFRGAQAASKKSAQALFDLQTKAPPAPAAEPLDIPPAPPSEPVAEDELEPPAFLRDLQKPEAPAAEPAPAPQPAAQQTSKPRAAKAQVGAS